ncbi:hypothetical protein BKA62DRAFT_716182 [Auriculariales sp. MPI-PUGE-AT-0066]|nr:hypothetical protein BKA62DRAFT_716182 [Auriculariales sp. MPI-PUGE-AT-0066]
MSWLLDFPPELLEDILEWVILGETPAPASIADAAMTRSPESVFSTDSQCKVFTQHGNVVSNTASLLRTNRLVAGRVGQAGLALKLDVLFVHERELWTTWVHVPYLSQCFNRIQVNLRIANAHVVGPALKVANDVVGRQITVETLDINISALEGVTLAPEDVRNEWLDSRRNVGGATEGMDDASLWLFGLAMRPEWLADILRQGYGLEYMLRMGEPYYGAILHERVGVLSVYVEDQLYQHYDVGQSFADLLKPLGSGRNKYYTYYYFNQFPWGERPQRFAKWWHAAFITRVQHGLSVGSASEADTPWPDGHVQGRV